MNTVYTILALFAPNLSLAQVARIETWVAWLRANPTRQSFGSLVNLPGNNVRSRTLTVAEFCCLGAGALCAHPRTTLASLDALEDYDTHLTPEWLRGGTLNGQTVAMLGLLSGRGDFQIQTQQGLSCLSLVELNDNTGLTYSQIADVIEFALECATRQCQHVVDGDTPPQCGMCSHEVDTDTQVCPECREAVAPYRDCLKCGDLVPMLDALVWDGDPTPTIAENLACEGPWSGGIAKNH